MEIFVSGCERLMLRMSFLKTKKQIILVGLPQHECHIHTTW